MNNQDKIILDLCGGTGSWSRPYREAGYDVRVITLPDYDVRTFTPPESVYGILAAPPCTMFCRMRMCQGRPSDKQFIEALSVVDACLRIVSITKPKFWALENPQGYLKIWLKEPQLKFNPCDYGDPWTKRTWIWGNFNLPIKNFVRPFMGSWVKKHVPKDSKTKQVNIAKTTEERSITPPGFAKAFFEANQ